MDEQRYLVTARKYRPSLFTEVVAQEHVTETLKNAIRMERLAHAYLFSGPRGVGKTTAARILAKAINCETPREEREDGAEPCCECDSCESFEAGRSLNVFEMDAASNNKVDDIRKLREKVRIPPQGDQKKVYILDEVHMLSKQAFNALLKTLEEPPAHALFIFATTEPHKVLPTILSRCQRFDFRRIPVPEIVQRLREICETEGVEADEESLMLLARKGNGALRDALSAFDQALSLCGATLEYGELTQALGVVDQDLYFRLTDHVAAQDTAGMIELVRHVVRSGYDLQEMLVGLAEHLRNLLVAHSLGGEALEEVAESTRTRYADEAERFDEADLLRLLTMAADTEDDIKQSPQPRLTLETTLLKMAQLRRSADLRAVLEKIDRLEQMAEDGDLPEAVPGDGATASETASSPPAPPESEKSENTETGGAAGREASPDGAPADVVDEAGDETLSASDEDDAPNDDAPNDDAPDDDAPDADAQGPDDGDEPPSSDAPADGTDASGADPSVGYNDLFGAPALGDDESSEGGSASGTADARASESASTSDGSDASAAAVAEPAVAAGPDADGVATEWPQVVQSVKDTHISLGSLLGEAEPVEYVDGTLTVAVPRALHRDTLRDRRRVLLRHVTDTVAPTVDDLRFVVEDTSDAAAADADTSDEPLSPREQLSQLRDTYPALDVLFSEFGAEPVW
ncbi:DNA polymerase III subunit gamma/tau [Salinibacter ruber]|uniref:DNA polymerase III subunit gamma/tau n=1 Tax=Salinibacter ruber TaxID=146919 RepID=A0A9X2ZYP4_9BACT|nr:DNA polymerase III subunit gamma/tau [Salinibacter ruber]MCS3613805.1 DNA polymerase-3 subunit gamma/tau [Salinibacter ruber]MCS3673582.1 DNA polymerase-3 subunit gamma/tau [Salinibacter ruber]MCS3782817.1 DNA polymerase-3 subunit gamma/tau [Salinibacter ruber]MCS4036193.1 DNA polymerase-3 subunit gamma/tau [Salinibacter ruber]MCS4138627.1 DNA polymerase-3 subunit gamma/tau [Salinibacter ruber]